MFFLSCISTLHQVFISKGFTEGLSFQFPPRCNHTNSMHCLHVDLCKSEQLFLKFYLQECFFIKTSSGRSKILEGGRCINFCTQHNTWLLRCSFTTDTHSQYHLGHLSGLPLDPSLVFRHALYCTSGWLYVAVPPFPLQLSNHLSTLWMFTHQVMRHPFTAMNLTNVSIMNLLPIHVFFSNCFNCTL